VADGAYPYVKGGVEQRYHSLANSLVARGHEVDWYTMKYWDGAPVMIAEGIRYIGICRPQSLYSGRRRSILEALTFGLACLRLLGRSERYDVVDCSQYPFFNVLAMWLVARRWRSALIVSWYETWGGHWREYLGVWGVVGRQIERWCARLPQCLVVVSEQALARLETEGLKPRRAVHVPLGVDCARIGRVPMAPDRVDVIYFGRLKNHKNVDILLRAVALLRAAGHAVRALIVGDGPEAGSLKALAQELALDGAVQFRGAVESSDELMSLVKAARLFVHPSTKEGGGSTATLEANACGTPTIAVDHPLGIDKSLIEEGVNGFWVRPLSAKVLADHVLRALYDPRLDGELRQAALQRSQAFDLAAVATRIEALYLQLADPSHTRA